MKKLSKKKYAGKCSSCLTGKMAYELDKRSPVCPYLICYKNKKCSYYVKLKEPKKNIFKRLFKKSDVI